jgi:CRP/FNR family cyclic AMP-dependent transcriptional regulator
LATASRKSGNLEAVPAGSLVDALLGVPLFAGLGRDELAPLAAMTVARGYRDNVMVFSQGDRADTMYFVLSGRVKVFQTGRDGREIQLVTFGPGSYFGDMMLDDGDRSASVMTLEPCRLGALSRDALRDFLKRYPDAALALIKNLSRRVREMNERVLDLTLVDVYGRVVKLLLSLSREVDGRWIVEERLTQQDIGDRVGASREMVSRVLKDLRTDNTIRVEGRRIVMLRKPTRSS